MAEKSSLIARRPRRSGYETVWWGMNAPLPVAWGYLLCSFAFITGTNRGTARSNIQRKAFAGSVFP